MRRGPLGNNNHYDSCIGIEDGPFSSRNTPNRQAPLVAVYFQGPHLRTVRATRIIVDGLDGTETALEILRHFRIIGKTPILLAGVTFAGFNLIDPHVLYRTFSTPILIVTGSRPHNRAVKQALVRHFNDWRLRWRIISSLGALHSVRTVPGQGPLYYESFGCQPVEARKILKSWALVSRLPEPLRVAGMIARGLFPSKPIS